MNTYFGAGGLGDLYICFCKALAYNRLDYRFDYEHCLGLADYDDSFHKEFLNMQGIDYKIIKNTEPESYYREHKADLTPLSTSWDGKRSGIIADKGWLDPFIGDRIKIKSQEVILIKPYALIQSSAGLGINKRPDRAWSSVAYIDDLAKLVKNKFNYNVYVIGNDDIKTEAPNLKDLKLGTKMNIVKHADLFIGFAGFLNFVASTNSVPVIIKRHEHQNYYMHPAWNIKTFEQESYQVILDLIERSKK